MRPRRYTVPMQVVTTGHSVYKLEYHVVWVCKYRRRVLNPWIEGYLRKVFPKLLKSMPGVEIHKIGFDKDHLHMVMTIPPKYSIADVMWQLRSQSSWMTRKRFPWLDKVYWKEKIFWSPGYFISSVGIDEDTVRNYVENQGKKDLGQLRMEL